MAYAVVATVGLVVLFRTGRFTMKVGYALLAVSTLFGFLVFAPMLPWQWQMMLVGNPQQAGVPLPLAGGVMTLFLVLAFLFGRQFCGYVCPIGTVQELVYRIPVPKLRLTNKWFPVLVRLAFLVAVVVFAVVLSVPLLRYLGVADFFQLNVVSAFFYAFLALVVVGLFFYRPFCRFLCPYGALLGLAAVKGLFKLRRNRDCIECGDCEEACPTGEATRSARKQECYMCNRCREVCPVNAIELVRRHSEQSLEVETGVT
ncbi:MAG: 4Fe-4S binding protein [Chloroflexota bacterium]